MADDGYVVVFTASSVMEAELIKTILGEEGIDARIPGELATDPWTTTEETLGSVPVEVPEAKAEQAKTIIAESHHLDTESEDLERWIAEHESEIPKEENEP